MMPKYMFNASYTTEGVQGLLSEGGSARVAAANAAMESVGGRRDNRRLSLERRCRRSEPRCLGIGNGRRKHDRPVDPGGDRCRYRNGQRSHDLQPSGDLNQPATRFERLRSLPSIFED